MNLQELRVRGFAGSAHIPFTKQYRVRCHSCEALVIQSTPCHETGCPEATHECAGCNSIISTRQRWCADCQ
jgi:rRNA maturation endonuclease Nob1